ncbi:MAG: chromosomal replication initiator protein DnaA [Lachnospiraceae bacterium]|nr:chromosomal replication initiator protein DnaA [Lachnospiraceae bacterium]
MVKNFENLKENWSKLLIQMKEDFEISDHIYDAFIKDVLTPVKLEKDTLYIEVPEEGYISFLQNRILSILRIAVSHETGISTENLDIIFKTKNNPSKKQKSETEDFEKLLKNSGISNPQNTFENFIQGSSNSIAYATCIAVAEHPGENYNPLLIYGKTGLGKTHLLHAIANYALKKNPNLNVLYTTCERYVQEYVDSIPKRTTTDFKNKYRNVDILLIDDIHDLAGKEQTQEEFFNTFNDLYDNKKQIVLTSDKPIKEMGEKIQERIKSRLTWGSTCEVYLPDYETRIAILRNKEKLRHPEYPVDNEVIKFIAQNVKSNIRELESSLNNIILYSKIINKTVDLEMAKNRLSYIKNKEENKITPEKITNEVCNYFGLNILDVCGPKRNREFVYARDIAIFLCRDMIKEITQAKIGEFFNRDHATVINSCKKIEINMKLEKDLSEHIKNIKEKLLLI